MDWHLRMAAQVFNRCKPNPVDADHHTGATRAYHRIMTAQQLIDRSGYVDGVHRHTAQSVSMAVQYRHHSGQPGLETLVRRIGDQLVVLDEVDVGSAQVVHQGCRLAGAQADAGFDDRADQRPAVHSGQPSGATDTKGGSREGGCIAVGQVQVQQAHGRDLAEFKQIARHRGEQRRQVAAHVLDRECNLDFCPVEHACVTLARDERTVQCGLKYRRQGLDAHHPGARPLLQLISFARQCQKGAGGLLARNHFRHLVDWNGALDQVAGAKLGAGRSR